MSVTTIKTKAEEGLAAIFAKALTSLPGTAINALREDARDAFLSRGLPHRRVEDWKYSDLRAFQQQALPLALKPDAQAVEAAATQIGAAIPGTLRLVLLDGWFMPELGEASSLPVGVRVESLALMLEAGEADVIARLSKVSYATHNAAVSLNTGLFADGLVLAVSAGVHVADTVQIVALSSDASPKAIVSRSLLTLGEGASLVLVEKIVSSGADQINQVLDVVIGDKASLSHIRRVETAGSSQILTTLDAVLGAGSAFKSFAYAAGNSAFLRQQMFLHFSGNRASAHVAGLSLLKGKQHADTTLHVHHDALACESRETFHHVLADEAHGVFQGKIVVDAEAQKTDGRMMSRTIMLNDGPSMDNKPELEIFADDVQCGHGCTCGELDEELLFYLQSRGIPLLEAQALMVQAFAGQALESIPEGAFGANDLDVREAFSNDVAAWVAGRSAS